MPIYEFQCGACGKRSDHLMRYDDPDPSACPECGAATLTRVLSAPQFRLAGAGWYETDFKGDNDRKRNLAGEAAGGEKPAETKPADKAADKPASAAPADAKPAARSESTGPAPATKPAA